MEDSPRIEGSDHERPLHVLLLEDSPLDAELIQATLTDGEIECELVRVESRADFLAALERDAFDLILSDYSLPSFDGLAALEIARARHPELPFIFISGAIGEERAIETLNHGATDYVLKDRLARLVPSVQRALKETADRAARAALATENERLYDEAQEASRRKDEFMAMLAHELRNPLAPILNALQIMRLQSADARTVEHACEVAERQAWHIARLLDDLLDVSRIRHGQITLRKQPVDLATVVEQAVESARPLIDIRSHKLSVTLPARPIWLEADPARLQQILVNLLNNAAKYTEPGGAIWVVAEPAGDQAVLRVRDTGIGITPDMLPCVFDVFAQADRSLDRSQGGLGIGLTLVHRLIELHGGSVAAFSAGLGQGSEFTVRLPALPAAVPDHSPVQPETPQFAVRRKRILLVDDNVDVAEMLGELLEMLGHGVRLAHDGPTALAVARDYVPEVVLLDIGLPIMDGYQVAQRLRCDPGLGHVQLIALTGYAQPEDRRRAREAGFDHHLAKPVHLPALQAAMDGVGVGHDVDNREKVGRDGCDAILPS